MCIRVFADRYRVIYYPFGGLITRWFERLHVLNFRAEYIQKVSKPMSLLLMLLSIDTHCLLYTCSDLIIRGFIFTVCTLIAVNWYEFKCVLFKLMYIVIYWKYFYFRLIIIICLRIYLCIFNFVFLFLWLRLVNLMFCLWGWDDLLCGLNDNLF